MNIHFTHPYQIPNHHCRITGVYNNVQFQIFSGIFKTQVYMSNSEFFVAFLQLIHNVTLFSLENFPFVNTCKHNKHMKTHSHYFHVIRRFRLQFTTVKSVISNVKVWNFSNKSGQINPRKYQ